jgi:hypothetical protein
LLRPSVKEVLVYARVVDTSERTISSLKQAGASIVDVAPAYLTVTIGVAPTDLAAVAALASVLSLEEAVAPSIATAAIVRRAGAKLAGTSGSCGATSTDAQRQLSADSARGAFSVDGSGVRVGILSNSYDQYPAVTTASQDVTSGALPGSTNPCGYTTPVTVQAEGPGGSTDEGRAMLQLVHDIAPASPLAFATAFNGIFDFANQIRGLQSAGAKVIADDATYFDEPMFQKGPVDVAVDDVVAAGATYFSSAGNENVISGGKNVGSYEAPSYRPTSCPAIFNSSPYLDCHNFNPSGTDNMASFSIAPGAYFQLAFQWAEPWYGVATDLDVYLLNSTGTSALASSVNDNFTTEMPFEHLFYENTTGSTQTVNLAIARFAGSGTPRLKWIIFAGGVLSSFEYNQSSGGDIIGPTVFGHNGSPNAVSVAAVPYNDRASSEPYTSHGPEAYYFGPVNGTTPASPLGSPQTVQKPDLAATDGVSTTFFGSLMGGVYRFYGTSAAAPDAAAVAALMLQRNPSLTPAQVKSTMTSYTHPVANGGGSDVVGAGLVDGLGAVGRSIQPGYLRAYTTPLGSVPGTISLQAPGGGSFLTRNQWATDWMTLDPGSYTITGSAVEGFTPPGSAPVVINSGSTTTMTLDYSTLGNLHVVLQPSGVPGTISIDGNRVDDYGFYAPYPAGAHQVCFEAVPDYDPPPCQNINVVADRTQVTTVTGTYTSDPGVSGETGVGYLRVAPTPAGAVPTVIYLDGVQRDQWGLNWMKLPPGSYMLALTDVEGYAAPASQMVSITAGLVTTVTPAFTTLGNLKVQTSPSLPGSIFVDGVPVNDWGVWTPFAAGMHEICFGYVVGYIAPACQFANVPANRGAPTPVTGSYATG